MADTKTKTAADDFPTRRFFANREDAAKALFADYQSIADLADYDVVTPIDYTQDPPLAGISQTDDGALVLDPTIYPDNMRVMISKLTTRNAGGKSVMRAIVVVPAPTTDQIVADEAGKEWLDGKIETELNRVAVQGLRDSKDADGNLIETDFSAPDVIGTLPRTLADYVTSSRQSTSGLLAAFEAHYREVKSALAKFSTAWRNANLPKKELRSALSSTAFARANYPTLEDAPTGPTSRGSLFVLMIGMLIKLAQQDGLDKSLLETWLRERDSAEYDAGEDDEDEAAPELTADFLLGQMADAAAE